MEKLLRNRNSNFTTPKAFIPAEAIPIRKTGANLSGGHILYISTNFQYTTEIAFDNYIEDAELTQMCMSLSEGSLNELWDNKHDDRWDDLLK